MSDPISQDEILVDTLGVNVVSFYILTPAFVTFHQANKFNQLDGNMYTVHMQTLYELFFFCTYKNRNQ